MSTIHPANEPNKGSQFLYPLWYVTVFAKESHTNGQTYYVRAPSEAIGCARAILLHSEKFEKITVEEVIGGWMATENGYGLGNGDAPPSTQEGGCTVKL